MNLSWSHVGVRVRFVAVIAAMVGAQAAGAQERVIWATDASIGINHGAGGVYAPRSNPVAELGVSVRKPLRYGIGLDAEVDYDWSWQTADPDLTCVVDAGGGCLPRFPAIGGPVGLAGVTWDAADVAELRVNAGLAWYRVNDIRLGAPVAAIDVALTPKSRLAVVVGARAFYLPNYLGNRLTVTTWRLGLRLQSRR